MSFVSTSMELAKASVALLFGKGAGFGYPVAIAGLEDAWILPLLASLF